MKVAAGQLRRIINEVIGQRFASKRLMTTVKEIRDLVKEEAEYVIAMDRLFGEPEQPVLRLKRRG